MMITARWCFLAPLAVSVAAMAQNAPMQVPLPAPRAVAKDIPYDGILSLEIDARDIAHRILRAHETVPVRGGQALTLLYPMWMPGNHAPRGPLQNVGGLKITANGKPLAWQRDPVEMAAFHVDVPAGVHSITVELAFLTPLNGRQGRILFTPDFLNLPWNALLLYPAGYYARDIRITPRIRLPEKWGWSTAMAGRQDGGDVSFVPTTLETLIDSPLYAARHWRSIALAGGAQPVKLDVFAESPETLEATAEQVELHRAMIRQVDRIFGTRPFASYTFLLSLSDKFSPGGTEHQQSSENRSDAGYFRRWASLPATRTLLPHEYFHAWNGKFLRPALTFTADYNTPTRNELLWVYEGLTNYYELVLAARSGLITQHQARDMLALTYAQYQRRPGREWRSLADTTNSAILSTRQPLPWPDYLRYVDYYDEGALLWLEADTVIRARSGGRKSLDDFVRLFFAGPPGTRAIRTYVFDDVVAALSAVQPFSWKDWLAARLDRVGPEPLTSLDATGYRLGSAAEASPLLGSLEAEGKFADFSQSIGMTIGSDGTIQTVAWGGAAFDAGLVSGMRVVAAGKRAYSKDALRAVIGSSPETGVVDLTIRDDDRVMAVQINYRGGLRYPTLERDARVPDRLAAIFAPR